MIFGIPLSLNIYLLSKLLISFLSETNIANIMYIWYLSDKNKSIITLIKLICS